MSLLLLIVTEDKTLLTNYGGRTNRIYFFIGNIGLITKETILRIKS